MASSTVGIEMVGQFLQQNSGKKCDEWTDNLDTWHSFGISAFWGDLDNGTAHFVGSAIGDARIIASTDTTVAVEFTMTNTTSLFSFLYHIPPKAWNITTAGAPMTNWTQTYTFVRTYNCCTGEEENEPDDD